MVFSAFQSKTSRDDFNPSHFLATEDVSARVFVRWKMGKIEKRRALGEGSFKFGVNTSFADILLPGSERAICATLVVQDKGAFLKCESKLPAIFVEGKRLEVGEKVAIGDMLEVTFGRHPVMILASTVALTPDHMKNIGRDKKRDKVKDKIAEACDPLQAEVDEHFANIDSLKAFLSKELLQAMDMDQIKLEHIKSSKVRERTRLKLRKLIGKLDFPEGYEYSREDLSSQVFDEVMGLGPLEPLLSDAEITEIMVNRRDQIYIEKAGKIKISNASFSSDQALMNVIERIVSTVGRRIDQSCPLVDARLLDGSRVNAVIPPLALKGPNLTIRRFSKTPISLEQLIEGNSLDQHMADFLNHMVKSHKNILISGGTGSGKTTLLNALSKFIPDNERIITVEDAAELRMQQPHVITLEARPENLEGKGAVTIRDLVKNTLRMRPDRIIVGECRGGEALDMLQAMNTGHDGSMTTAHANSPEDMLRRLETMVLMAGMDLPLRAIREQIASALTIVVQQQRRKDGFRRVTSVAWIKGLDRETGQYIVEVLIDRDAKDKVDVNRDALEKFWEFEEIHGTLDEILPALPGKAKGRRK
jgi:pilus assembly protein CpaF